MDHRVVGPREWGFLGPNVGDSQGAVSSGLAETTRRLFSGEVSIHTSLNMIILICIPSVWITGTPPKQLSFLICLSLFPVPYPSSTKAVRRTFLSTGLQSMLSFILSGGFASFL